MFKTARQRYPEKYRELASIGFKQAVSLLGFKLKKTDDEIIKMLCLRLERAEEQVRPYLLVGLPDNLVHPVLTIMKQHDVLYGAHQLKPTRRVIEMDIWREEEARKR